MGENADWAERPMKVWALSWTFIEIELKSFLILAMKTKQNKTQHNIVQTMPGVLCI